MLIQLYKQWHYAFFIIFLLIIFKHLYDNATVRMFPTIIFNANEQNSHIYSYEELPIQEYRAMHKRELHNQLKELFYSLNNTNYSEIEILNNQAIKLLAIAENITNSDEPWHRNILARLGDHFQSVLHQLQNPPNCSEAKILICNTVYPNCGFGCIIHHISFWFTIAAAANRTFILENDGKDWAYEGGWDDIFQPISKCKYNQAIYPNAPPFPEYIDGEQQDRIVRAASDELRYRLSSPNAPLVVPNKYAKTLIIHNANPPLWFMGQKTFKFMNYLWKFNYKAMKRISDIESSLDISFNKKEPIFGMHVRRTDKNKEAEGEYFELNDYMKWIKLWLNIEMQRTGMLNKTSVSSVKPWLLFLATDEPNVILEARKLFENEREDFKILALEQDAKLAQKVDTRYTNESLFGLIAEINILAKCDFVVCTFTSNICRLIAELMEATRGNADRNVHSLDLHFHEWLVPTKMLTTKHYNALDPKEISAQINDSIEINRLYWNGTVKGKNLRTGQSGYFPSYLLKKEFRTADFTIFD